MIFRWRGRRLAKDLRYCVNQAHFGTVWGWERGWESYRQKSFCVLLVTVIGHAFTTETTLQAVKNDV